MLSLKKLRFCNIGRFVVAQEIDFTQFDKLIQVNGFNKNTGGSSGAAKSTVFNAQDYLLGINDIPATALQSRLTKEGIWVEGEYDVDGTTLIIKRSKKDGLTLQFGDESVSGNVKLAEERLDEIIGIPRKLFKKMVHKKQKEGGFFLNLTAKESYDFLMNALGLEKFKSKTAKIDEDIKEITNTITRLGLAITAFEQSIEEIDELKEFERKPFCDVNIEDLAKTKEELDGVIANIQAEEKETKKILDSINLTKPTPKIISVDKSLEVVRDLENNLEKLKQQKLNILTEHLTNKNKLTKAADDIKKQLSEIPHAKSTIERIANEMKELMAQKSHIESSKCPTCMQQWAGDNAQTKINNINQKLAEHKASILSKKAILDKEPEILGNLERINTIIQKMESQPSTEELDNQISEIQKNIIIHKANFDSEKQKLENEYLKSLNEHNEKIRAAKEVHEQLVSPKKAYADRLRMEVQSKSDALKHYEISMAIYNEKMAKMESTLAEKRANLKSAIEQREEKANKLAVVEETKRLIKTYTLQIFQETLDHIGEYATEILSNIPNMSNSTIYFEGCKETGSGSIKDEVNAIINMDGYNDINIKTLSGGERTAIDLAVDLAVIDMIESKAGKGADFFVLDEPFDGLEEINISQCLEILKQIDTNKKIIIVDHNPVAKEMITDTIMVERDGEESVVL